MKSLCLTTEKLNELMSDLYKTTCEVVFCEEREIEVIRMSLEREIALEDAFEELDAHFNVEITSFDVMELGEVGEVFVFIFQ